MKQSYETKAILNDARIEVNKIYTSKEVREDNCADIYNLIINDECIIPKEYWITVINNVGESTTKKGIDEVWSKCISLSGGSNESNVIQKELQSYSDMIGELPMDVNCIFLIFNDEDKNINNSTYQYFKDSNKLIWVASTEQIFN